MFNSTGVIFRIDPIMSNRYLSRPLHPICSFLFLILLAITSAVLFPKTTPAQEDAPDDAVAVFNQAQDLHEKGDLTAAVKLYARALEIEPQFPEAEYQSGVAELGLGKTADAEKAFRRALALRQDWTLPMTALGSLLVEENKNDEAEKLLSRVIELEPQNSSALCSLVEFSLKTKAAPPVLQDLLTKISALTAKANPTASLWSAKAALELELGKRNAAGASLASALTVDPKHKPALYQAADMALAESDVERARDIVKTLEELAPNAEPLSLLKAKLLAAEGKTDDALKLLEPLAASSSEAAALKTQLSASGPATAVDLEKQLAAEPANAAILGRLCTLFRRDDPQKALGYCKRASEAEPGNVNHAIGFAAALIQAKQYDTAAGILRQIIQLAPENWTAHANLATALFQLKRYKEAKPEFVWLTMKQAKLPAPYLFLGITFDQLGEYMDALANYQLFLKLADPAENSLDIEKVKLRLPELQRLVKGKK
jgi:tetratricopeptide (TPR) repeat protein